MHDMSDEDRREVLGEALMHELKAIREYVEDVPAIKKNVQILKEDVEELKFDTKVVKAAVTDLSTTVKKHDKDIAYLKQKIA